jgi:hypothetical protein
VRGQCQKGPPSKGAEGQWFAWLLFVTSACRSGIFTTRSSSTAATAGRYGGRPAGAGNRKHATTTRQEAARKRWRGDHFDIHNGGLRLDSPFKGPAGSSLTIVSAQSHSTCRGKRERTQGPAVPCAAICRRAPCVSQRHGEAGPVGIIVMPLTVGVESSGRRR